MVVGFDGAQPVVVAVDGQNCPAFEPLRNALPLAPGGRFDVMVDMPEQEGASARIALLGDNPEIALLTFKAEGKAVEARPPLGDPMRNPLLPETIALQRAQRAELVLTRSAGESAALCSDRRPAIWSINGKPGGYTPLFSVRRGTPVSLGLTNKSATHVVIRLHGHSMRQLHSWTTAGTPTGAIASSCPQGAPSAWRFSPTIRDDGCWGRHPAPRAGRPVGLLHRHVSEASTFGICSGKSSAMSPGPKARAAAPCIQTPALAASKPARRARDWRRSDPQAHRRSRPSPATAADRARSRRGRQDGRPLYRRPSAERSRR